MTHACPGGPHDRSPIGAHVPALQHELPPHVPFPAPPQAALHAPLVPHVGDIWPHGWQALPLCPHFALSVPGWQVIPSQQPPAHCRLPAHDDEQVCVPRLHAVPAAQSPGPLQPQAWPPVVTTHACPFATAVHATHWPGAPQLVGVFAHAVALSTTTGASLVTGASIPGAVPSDAAASPPPVPSFAASVPVVASSLDGPASEPTSLLPLMSSPHAGRRAAQSAAHAESCTRALARWNHAPIARKREGNAGGCRPFGALSPRRRYGANLPVV